MKVIAVLKRTAENPDYSIDRWAETKTFDATATIGDVLNWAVQRRIKVYEEIVLAVDQSEGNCGVIIP